MLVTDWFNWDGILYLIWTFSHDCWAIGVIFVPLELALLGFGIFVRVITLLQSFGWKKAGENLSPSDSLTEVRFFGVKNLEWKPNSC